MAGEAWGCRDCADTGRTWDWEQDGEGIKQVQVPCPTCAAHFAAVREARAEAFREAVERIEAQITMAVSDQRGAYAHAKDIILSCAAAPEPGRKGE